MRVFRLYLLIIVAVLSIVSCGNKNQGNSGNGKAVKLIKQASGIGFRNVTDSQIGVYWLNGDGQNRIICISTDSKLAKPQPGQEYKAGRFGDASCRLDNSNTFVVYNSSATQKDVGTTIAGLKQNTKYFIQIFEYNVIDGKSVYILNSADNNPRFITTSLSAPKALQATNLVKGGFQVNWERAIGIEYYEIDLSTDSEFTKFVDIYNSANIGDLGKYEFADLKTGTYYYRLRSVNKGVKSSNSNVVKVIVK